MRIAFLSSLNPNNIGNWSGTLFYMFQNLNKEHYLIWIGRQICEKIKEIHWCNYGSTEPLISVMYGSIYGQFVSAAIKTGRFDLIICRDNFFISHIDTDLPIIYIGDATFHLFKDYGRIQDSRRIFMEEYIEQQAINNATHIIYSSEWAKESAIFDYGANRNKVSVIEFGANIDFVPWYKEKKIDSRCNLLFIGKNWLMKGGPKVLETYSELISRKMNCSLTIIGSQPIETIDVAGVSVYPYITKATKEGQSLFKKLLMQSHLLIAPTLFDCFGIVYCEAAAYGIPVLTSNVGGVGQVIQNNENGYLLHAKATKYDYADAIQDLCINKPKYNRLSRLSRLHYENRLNWDVWREKVNNIICNVSQS